VKAAFENIWYRSDIQCDPRWGAIYPHALEERHTRLSPTLVTTPRVQMRRPIDRWALNRDSLSAGVGCSRRGHHTLRQRTSPKSHSRWRILPRCVPSETAIASWGSLVHWFRHKLL